MNEMAEVTLLPFNFARVGGGHTLVTSFTGEYALLDDDDFDALLQTGTASTANIAILKTKFFMCEKANLAETINIMKIKYKAKRSYLKNDSLLLMVIPTNGCDSDCIYCQASSQKSMSRQNTMDIGTALHFCDFVLGLPHNEIKIEFQGGEPLLAFEIIELIVLRLKWLNRKTEKRLSFVICTNLLSLTDHQITFIKKHGIAISTSLDGPEHIHNMNRPSRMVSSPYIKVIEILARLRKVRIFPSALVTITSHGIDKIDQIVDAYIQNGFTSLFLRPLNPYGYAYGNPAFSYTADAFFDSYKCALEYIINKAKDGVAIREEFFSILLRKVLTPFNDGFVDLQNPSAIGSMCMIVDQHGDIYPSDEARMIAAMSDDRWKVGSIRDNDCGIKMRDARKDILRTGILELWPECTFCVYNAYCSADPVKIYYKAAYTHDRYCTTNKKMFDLLFSYILDADVRMQAVLRKWANAQ